MVNRDQDKTETNNMSKNAQPSQTSGSQNQKSAGRDADRDDNIGNRSSQGVDPKTVQKNQSKDVNQKPQTDKSNFNQGSGMTSNEKRNL